MGLWFVQYACVDLEWCCIITFVHMWSICVSLIVMFSKKMNLKLYLFISAYNVDNWIIFVKKFILNLQLL